MPEPETKPVDVDKMVRTILEPMIAQDAAASKALEDALHMLYQGQAAIKQALVDLHNNNLWLIRRLVLSGVIAVPPKEKEALGLPVSAAEWIAAGVKPKAAAIRASEPKDG